MLEQIERLDRRSKTQSKQISPANLHDYNAFNTRTYIRTTAPRASHNPRWMDRWPNKRREPRYIANRTDVFILMGRGESISEGEKGFEF